MPEFSSQTNYADEYWRTYLQNEINCALIRELAEKKGHFEDLIAQI